MSKKHKQIKFSAESVIRLAVFMVLISLAIGYLSNSKSTINLSFFDSKVLGDYSPKIEDGQKWFNVEVLKLKEQALDQFFLKIKSSILK